MLGLLSALGITYISLRISKIVGIPFMLLLIPIAPSIIAYILLLLFAFAQESIL